MATLTVNAKGQLTLGDDVLKHLGVKPGDQIALELSPGGQVTLRAVRSSTSIESIFGILAGKTTKVATLEEIEEATQMGWAGQVRF